MRILSALLTVLAAVCVCPARTITVDDDGPADFSTIQAAIDDANDGDTIIVAQGRYYEETQFHGKNIRLTSTGPDNQDVVASTIIDGNGVNCAVSFSGTEDQTCLLSGFTITNGMGPQGGGIWGNGTMAAIANNLITGNISTGSYRAGAISECDGLIENNIITNNYASDILGGGGGLSMCDGTIRGNMISNNSAEDGGGLYNCDGLIENNIITNNYASDILGGGGLYGCDGTIRGNTISDNRAERGGGLSRCDGTIRGNTISNNSAEDGGGLFDCDGAILNNLIVGNFSAGRGAGLCMCDGAISHCTIAGNSGSGAVHWCYGPITNCIIWLNTPREAAPMSYSSVPAYSCVENWEQGGIGNISGDPCFADPGYWDSNDTPDDANDDFWVHGGGDYHLKSEAGRWDANEGGATGLLRGWTSDEVTSPCIDAGDPMMPVGLEPFPNGGTANMGAYGGTIEASKSWFGGPVCETIIAGDINGDCRIDFADLRFIGLHWLGCPTRKPDNEDYFPLHVGNSWTYLNYDDDSVQTFTIIGTEEINGHTYYRFDDYFRVCGFPGYSGGWGGDDMLFRYDPNSDRVLQYRSDTDEDLVRYDFSGLRWSTYGHQLIATGISCRVPAGDFYDCCKFWLARNEKCGIYFETLAPNIGPVESVTNFIEDLKLQSYTVYPVGN